MDIVNEIMNLVGIEYFMEDITYSFDLKSLHIKKEYPHTNSIFTFENELLNVKWEG